ncbi:BREX-1 system adenine-specific DNA-methyltransferase PglX [Flavobacterium xueshanense]|uniref:site-specific DNA-methyltransferase (adenine-specific) n=1 Tax=Flavobacterium xueshanense TaxID=935223 RepID=A0A1I2IPD5_9FLAO|nr:BREX-1 system adenine-specific DNA-methyltransferase PglX [Flavobacterium xueshanense]SFF42696.1 Methyltransferase domain-containing protein [Flavobacterium xueshanense]
MNTNALKKFAQEARRKLIEQVSSKLEYVLNTDTPELREKADQINKLKEAIQSTSKEQVIDKVTYTWFNRFMALRFMDANDYQPIGIRVLTPKNGYTLPELLDEAKQGNIPEALAVKNKKIFDLLDGKIPSANAQNEAYKELLIGACNHLNKVLPFLFERINDYTELLLPDDLTSELSIVQDIRDGMSIEDCAEVEVIGWLYQFYISEKKDEVFASKGAVKKEDIPAATQLFTPRWIVEYMVQNTVGKLWLQNKPNSKLREYMPYFIESPSVTSEEFLKINSVEEITLLDQACGSGHILVYGFELLAKIYEEEGYNPNEIPELIITKNLFGFEIDERASQLAGMALMMKARSYNRRFFRKDVDPNILCYKDLVLTSEEINEAFIQIGFKLSKELNHDLLTMQQATNFGSLIIPLASKSDLQHALDKIKSKVNTGDAFLKYQLEELKITLEQLLFLSNKYYCIVDNPPYMGGGNMNKVLGDYVKANYPDSKADLMTCFMEAGWNMLLPKGILGMINLPSWLFLSSFEKLRKKLIKEKHIDSLLHMGRGIFGVDWGSTAFIIQNQQLDVYSRYFKLHKRNFQHLYPEDIQQIFLKAKDDSSTKINFDKYREGDGITSVDELVDENGLQISYSANQIDFNKIPGTPIGYWATEKLFDIYEKNKTFSNYSETKIGQNTGDNNRFLRNWFEIIDEKFDNKLLNESNLDATLKWVPYRKGGNFRKWAGNEEYCLNWENNGKEVKDYSNFRNKGKGYSRYIVSLNYCLKEGITWSFISSNKFNVRWAREGAIFDVAGSSCFPKNIEDLDYLLGFLNSCVAEKFISTINPTLNIQGSDVKNLPLIQNIAFKEIIKNKVKEIKLFSKQEWDSRETSWDFNKSELIRITGQDLGEIYDLFKQYWNNKFFQLHENEEELNRQFIEIYGLEDELKPEVPLEEITILKEETIIKNGQLVFKQTEVFAQFMSYAVGCMFGRYSLDKEGLILANQGETLEDYLAKVELSEDELSFTPDEDNIIPVLDDEWFEDDITGRFYAFLKASFGKENFDKNLAFVEECLGKDVRKYFVKDFYNDHIKRYKKRPIYWMFSSPKGAFNVMIYMHRYTPDTLNKILNSYLIQYREKLNTHLEHLAHLTVSGTSIEQTKAIKETEKLKLALLELKEYERDILYPMATDRINIDLDEGVLVNYNKFGNAIKEVKGLNDKVTKKKVRAFDWIDKEQIR